MSYTARRNYPLQITIVRSNDTTTARVKMDTHRNGTFEGVGFAQRMPADPDNQDVANMISAARAMRVAADQMESHALQINAVECEQARSVRQKRKLRRKARKFVKHNVPKDLRGLVAVK